MKTIIDAHCHIFNAEFLPETFERRYTMHFNPKFLDAVLKVFTWMDKDTVINRAENLLKISFSETILDVAGKIRNQAYLNHNFDRNVVFAPLTMDMYYGLDPKKREEIDNNFHKQIEQTTKVVLKYPGNFLPFLAIHPERVKREGSSYVFDALEKKGFWGVKVYPPLGHFPSDKSLYEIYEYCESKNVPITTHSSYAGTYADIPNDLNGNQLSKIFQRKKKYWGEMANPLNWAVVLQDFPKLKLNFGHFGGDVLGTDLDHIPEILKRGQENIEKKWRETAVNLIQVYENVYADISFHPAIFIDTVNYFNRLKEHIYIDKISDKIQFGTDWWMSSFLLEESEYIDIFQKFARQQAIDDMTIEKIMFKNSTKFLGLDDPDSWSFKNYVSFLENNQVELPTWFIDEFNL